MSTGIESFILKGYFWEMLLNRMKNINI